MPSPGLSVRIAALLLLALTLAACQPLTRSSIDESGLFNIALGNPSGAASDRAHRNNFLIVKRQYALSYNNENGGPNWVCWRLRASDIGTAFRQNDFHPEPLLPASFQHVVPSDYTGSGYDRGHMCDSKDRTASPEDNSETFSMANMLPQAPDLNRHVWERLESYCRGIVNHGSDVYIIAGGYGSVAIIGKENQVNVPSNCWKIVVVLPAGGDISQIDQTTRLIAVDMPNVQGIAEDPWQKYLTTVKDLEQKTGYHFLTSISDPVRSALLTQKAPLVQR